MAITDGLSRITRLGVTNLILDNEEEFPFISFSISAAPANSKNNLTLTLVID